MLSKMLPTMVMKVCRRPSAHEVKNTAYVPNTRLLNISIPVRKLCLGLDSMPSV